MKLGRRRKSGTALAVEDPVRKLWQVTMTGLVMAVFVILLAIAGPRPAASAEGVALGYEGYLGGLHMMTAEVDMARNDENYWMETNAEGRGLIGWIIDWRSKAVTEGVIGQDGVLRPLHHRRDMIRGGKPAKIMQIEYRDDGVPLVARLREGDEAHFTEVENRKGTVDPMSAVTAIVDQMAAGQACTGQFQVFDGKLRYDVTAEMGEPRRLSGNKYMMYKGIAERCDLNLKAIDGFDDDDEPKGNPRERKTTSDDTMVLTLWFASPVEGLPSVPVMASADSDYGGLRIYLARAQAAEIPTEGQRAELR
ncbi:MAG: DUF3108 domain-containing protein [Proteobacteria bacterium]|nr:DUF3108 domain-containing protein [Pseudomonadota bacterium]